MSDFPAMNWHELAESHAYWRRRVMRPRNHSRATSSDARAFLKNYIALAESIYGTTERSQSGRSLTRHDARSNGGDFPR
jgi:hypothetical protein